ncbi:MAG: hypothetical protein CVU08_13550 [Bacteroidetes bacterium HGW-Bacteroidetes-3]|nr:MAG: hypothetical protein CVU08_13550 [Bacteroidetes bacterium HGW-Bacteroidetes-3]
MIKINYLAHFLFFIYLLRFNNTKLHKENKDTQRSEKLKLYEIFRILLLPASPLKSKKHQFLAQIKKANTKNIRGV